MRIVSPLVIVAIAVGVWRIKTTTETASEIFDRNLTAVSVAVARDVASSGGELLSSETADLLADASGGKVFYHVRGPDGAYVSGFGHPPGAPTGVISNTQIPVLFDSHHSGDPVRVAGLTQYVNASGLEGFAQITVWQKLSVRRNFTLRQTLFSIGTICLLVVAVMAFIWFGVNAGLAPLIDLRNAIAQRSPQDLRPITRRVPEEVVSLVGTLNSLFGEVRRSINAKDQFIANAAHQLRNPISAVQALAEAALNAPTVDEAQRRIRNTVEGAKKTSHLAEQLLMLERLSQSSDLYESEPVDLNRVILKVSSNIADKALDRGVDMSFEPATDDAVVNGDDTLLSQAVENLVDNALKHGGEGLSRIGISLSVQASRVVLVIEDDGKGIAETNHDTVFERFVQLDHGPGSGLGLAIVKEVVLSHSGSVHIRPAGSGRGTRFEIRLPLREG